MIPEELKNSYMVVKLPAKEWDKMCEDAHVICFNEIRPKHINRIDFALLIIDNKTNKPVSYITVKEFDSTTCYWQHGGSFPGSVGIPAWRSYNLAIAWSRQHYKRIFTLIENRNVAMLKMAMKAGFRIIGTKTIDGDIMVEHIFNLEE